MAAFSTTDRPLAQQIAGLAYCNPFLPQRIEHERAILGDAFDERTAAWNLHPDWGDDPPNVECMTACAEELAQRVLRRAEQGARWTAVDRALYGDVIVFLLYHRHRPDLEAAAQAWNEGRPTGVGAIWDAFSEGAQHLLAPREVTLSRSELAHVFACFFHLCRAFRNVFHWILGVSQPAVKLRAAVWQSIFTHDMRRYRRVLFDRMGDYTTLVTGPSGTGKELVARAIALSRYVPFDPRSKSFAGEGESPFHTLNLSALSATLIESELFGHKRGAFTGAIGDRKGWLEACPPLGSVFLDEIGEVEASIQVKLLRVLEDRKFCRVGETRERSFRGKIIAATNRDLAAEMHAGRFRTDLYYRLCADTVRTPSLRERLADSPEELRHLVTFLSRRCVGEEAEAFADEVESWIGQNLGSDYAWPGNVRELEQCVRNILIRREYSPPQLATADGADPWSRLAEQMRRHALSADTALRRYCTLVYRATGSFEKAAAILKLDRRTVRAKVDAGS